MAIKNKKTPSKENPVKNRLQAKLREGYNEFLNEEDDDLSDDTELDTDDDFGGDDFGGDDDFEDEGDDSSEISDDDFEDEDIELTPDQNEFFDDQIDSLLEPEFEEPELDELDENEDFLTEDDEDFGGEGFGGFDEDQEEDLDLESDSDDLDFDTDDLDDEYSEDGYISDDELDSIVDLPNTYDVLGDTLKDIAVEEVPSEDDDFGLEDELDAEAEVEAELEEGFDLYDQTGNFNQQGNHQRKVDEAKKAKAAKKLKEEVKLTSELKDLEFCDEDSDLEGSYSKVTKPSGKDGKIEHNKSLTQTMKSQTMQKEAIQKSKMLVKAAKAIDSLNLKVKKLQLENYKLLKSNGILSAAADKLDKESRTKISESFGKCSSKAQVDTLYEKVVKTIKQKARPSLNEAVANTKRKTVKTVTSLNESFGKEKPGLSYEQQRINALMGLATDDDVYFNNL